MPLFSQSCSLENFLFFSFRKIALHTTNKTIKILKAGDKIKRWHWRGGMNRDVKHNDWDTLPNQLNVAFVIRKLGSLSPLLYPKINAR